MENYIIRFRAMFYRPANDAMNDAYRKQTWLRNDLTFCGDTWIEPSFQTINAIIKTLFGDCSRRRDWVGISFSFHGMYY